MKTRTLMGAVLAGAIGLAIGAGPAAAGAISTNTWYTFSFDAPGSALAAGNTVPSNPAGFALDAAPWTFTLSGPAELRVTDLQVSGDYFTFFDFGVLVGTTGTGVAFASGGCNSDIACALADPNYGKGIFALGAGSHSLTGIFNGDINFGDGALIVREVPEPLTLSLFGAGFAGAVAMRRRKKKSA